MNEHNTSYFVEKYPSIYNKNFEFECGDGWFNVIDSLSNTINVYMSKNDKIDIEINVGQVKEKFGELRYYHTSNDYTNFINGAIAMAVSMSRKTCEICGSPGNQKGDRWIFTRCDVCYRNMEEERGWI